MSDYTVGHDADGLRLDRFLALQPGVETRSAAERLLSGGVVTVDGERQPKSHRVTAGSIVTVTEMERPAIEVKPRPDVPVVYSDDHVLVIDKPAGLLTHPAPGVTEPTLVDALGGRAGGGDPGRTGIVHRLDRDTSGLLVVARDDVTLLKLQALLRKRRIARTYTALVAGLPPSRSGRIDAPIGRDRHHPTRISMDTDVPREAVTRFELVEQLEGRSLLRVELDTGRTHQIRVHLQAIGHPVVGDPVYGHGPELGLDRQFLHASRLAFPHPWSGEPVEVTSPLPDDLARALDAARATII